MCGCCFCACLVFLNNRLRLLLDCVVVCFVCLCVFVVPLYVGVVVVCVVCFVVRVWCVRLLFYSLFVCSCVVLLLFVCV